MNEAKTEFAKKVAADYCQKFSKSQTYYEHFSSFFPNGTSQYGRMINPFPIHFEKAVNAYLHSVDGHKLIDLWTGHFCMSLGHARPEIFDELKDAFENSLSLQVGVPNTLEGKVAEAICDATGYDQVTFSTSGALATMHALQIAAAATGKHKILRIEGGWHGVQPWATGGKTLAGNPSKGNSEGVPEWFFENVVTIPFNDVLAAEEAFDKFGSELSSCIAELVLGGCGMVMASPEFIQSLRRLCDQYGVLLILDELVTGFRVSLGGMQDLFGVRADISIYGKALGGGMPFACIASCHKIFASSVNKDLKMRIQADAGTFTSHPATLVSVNAFLNFQRSMGTGWFVGICDQALNIQKRLETIIKSNNLAADVTGKSTLKNLNAFPISTIRFKLDEEVFDNASIVDQHWNKNISDANFRDCTARQYLATRGIFSWQGFGVVHGAIQEGEVEKLFEVYEDFFRLSSNLFPTK